MANTFFPIILIPLLFIQYSKAQSQFSQLNRGSSLEVEHYHQPFLVSQDETFSCGFYPVGENAFTFSIWFTNTKDKTVAWTANRDSPVNGHGSKISFRRDGNLVLRDVNGSEVWSTSTNSLNDASTVSILNTGNLVIHDSKGNTLWQSFDSPTDTLLPHQFITKGSRVVSAATSKGVVGSGYYSLFFDNDNALKLMYDSVSMSSIYWPNSYYNVFQNGRTSYNSSRIAGLDETGRFVSSDGLTISASDLGAKRVRRLTLDSDGNLRMYSLNKSDGGWEVSWEAISQPCNVHGLCGINGICQYWGGISCTCPPGYEKNDLSKWNGGCKPKFIHRCNATKSRFVELAQVDFYGFDLGSKTYISYDDCEKLCLQDCTCIGFSYRINGGGWCFPKYSLFNGFNSTNFPGSFYIRIPVDSDYSLSESRGILDCSNVTSDVLIGSPIMFSTSQNNTKWSYIFVFIAVFGALETVLLVIGWWFLFRDKEVTKSVEEGYQMILSQFRRFTYRELKEATGNFKEEIGRGSSGVVFRGVLDDKRVVAVKKLNDVTQEEEEFRAEVSLIGRINHMNLVRMFGVCSERQHRVLVYEHMENKSLDKFLFENNDTPLDWGKRFRIALGAAKGLLYLHHECLEWIIHCDVKPENILLAKDFEPKIADFGLVKLSKRDGSGFATMRMRGTMGYMAPEWVLHQPITSKVDVYSYGVVLLEIVMGRRVSSIISDIGECPMRNFTNEVKRILDAGDESVIASLVDIRLQGQFNYEQAFAMLRVAVACLEEDRKQRPTMSEVVQDLMANEEIVQA